MSAPLQKVLDCLKNVRKSGKGYTASCPSHEDSNPSLSISEGDDGQVLMHCHKGCKFDDIVAAMNLRPADLFPTKAISQRCPRPRSKPSAQGRSYSTEDSALDELQQRHGNYSALWKYHNLHGEPVGLVVRWDRPNGKKDIRPVSLQGDRWQISAMPYPRPLYGLPQLAEAGRVIVVEGEKAADAARSLGYVATTSAGGSQAAETTDLSPLAGKEVWIMPDNDPPGRKYAKTVASILLGLDPTAIVKIIEIPGLPEKGDIVDWIKAHGNTAKPDEMRAKLEALAHSITQVESETIMKSLSECSIQMKPILTCMADVEPTEVRWLWKNRIPMGRATVLVGRPGEGKSFLTTALAACVSTGRDFPDGESCPQGSVIILSAEDDPADTIRPRLDAHNANPNNVYTIKGVEYSTKDGNKEERAFTLVDVTALETVLKEKKDCKLVIIDPMGSFLGGGTDAHRDNEVRSLLTPVIKMAAKYNIAIVIVCHRKKGSADFADETALGSVAFTGIARAVWHLSRDPEDKDRRLLLPGKNNLSPEGTGLAFRIEGEPPHLVWEPDPIDLSANDAMYAEGRVAAEKRKPGPKTKTTENTVDWLRKQLSQGSISVADLKDRANADGIHWRTVERASQEIEVQSERMSGNRGYQWRLKTHTDIARSADSPHNSEPARQNA